MSNGRRVSLGTMPYSSSAANRGSTTGRVATGRTLRRLKVPTMSRAICSAWRSSSAKWSATPETEVCTSAPPSDSASTTSPVAAFTSGGPPRKMVPWFLTITLSSDMAGM